MNRSTAIPHQSSQLKRSPISVVNDLAEEQAAHQEGSMQIEKSIERSNEKIELLHSNKLCLRRGDEVSQHFWFAAFSGLDSAVYLSGGKDGSQVRFAAYDCCGRTVNEGLLSVDPEKGASLHASHILEGCVTHGGFRQAHLELFQSAPDQHFPETRMQCFLEGGAHHILTSEPMPVMRTMPRCVPCTFSPRRNNTLLFLNPAEEDLRVRCRVFVGNRSPEEEFLIPSKGLSLVGIEVEFPGLFESHESDSQGYVRITSLKDVPCGVHSVEQTDLSRGHRMFQVIN